MSKTVTIHRRAHFNAAHRLYNVAWTDEKNLEIFGKCAYPNYHGHNYELVVSVTGQVDPDTGFVMNLSTLKKILNREILEYLDHKNLNVDIVEFQMDKGGLIPTAENICIVIWEKLRNKLPTHLHLKVRLYETSRNFVDYQGDY